MTVISGESTANGSASRRFPRGHVSLVTGASTGIGAATALTLAARGSRVVVHYHRNGTRAKCIAEQICASGGDAIVLQADLSQPGSAQLLIDSILERAGRVDAVINNAGSIVGRKRLLEITDEFMRQVFEINFGSALRVTQSAAPSMIERGSGAIVNVGSISARTGGSSGVMAYASAKAALLCFTKALAKELIHHGIRVNAVNPGVIDTPLHENFTPADAMKALVANIPQGRAGRSEEVASAIAFLAGEEASHIVGETLEVNGGIWMD